MATSNLKKKLAALSELRKDPAAAIERAIDSIRRNIEDYPTKEDDFDLIDKLLNAIVADIRNDAKKGDPN